MKTRTRIALVFFLLTTSVLVTLSIAVYYFSMQYTFSDFYKRLTTRAQLAARIRFEPQQGEASPYAEVRKNILEKLPNEIDYFFDPKDFKTITDSLGVPNSFVEAIVSGRPAEHRDGNVFYAGMLYDDGERSFITIVSAESYYYSHHVANLRNILITALVLISLFVFSLSFIFSQYVFRPIQQITQQVKDITFQNLHLRLKAGGVNDEVNELKVTFNTMLDRLEAAFATQNNFISNASHELSTPLTAIIGEAEVTLSKTREVAEYENTLRTISSHAERLERITRSLLFLAQTGFDGIKQKWKYVRIDQLLYNVKETIEHMNPRNAVRIHMGVLPDSPYKLKILGNEQLLHLALTNIVSNACKYSDHKPVDVSLSTSDWDITIVIADQGIGIPQKEMEFIYEPFFRASNTMEYEGYGIGLPLTRNIVRIHKGTMHVQSELNKGTKVELIFPMARILNEF